MKAKYPDADMSNRRIFPTYKVMSNQRNLYHNEDAIKKLLQQRTKVILHISTEHLERKRSYYQK